MRLCEKIIFLVSENFVEKAEFFVAIAQSNAINESKTKEKRQKICQSPEWSRQKSHLPLGLSGLNHPGYKM